MQPAYAPRLRLWVELPTVADCGRVNFHAWAQIVDGYVLTLPTPHSAHFRPVLAELDRRGIRYVPCQKASPFLGSAKSDPTGAQLGDPRNYANLGAALLETAAATGADTVVIDGESVCRVQDETGTTYLRNLGGGGPLVKHLATLTDALRYLVYPGHAGVCPQYGHWLWAWNRAGRHVRGVHVLTVDQAKRGPVEVAYLADHPAETILDYARARFGDGVPELWLFPGLAHAWTYAAALLRELPS